MKRNFIITIAIIVILILVVFTVKYKNNIKENELEANTNLSKIYDTNGKELTTLTNEKKVKDVIKDTFIMGTVEVKKDEYIYIFGGQHFGEKGYEVKEYTTANIPINSSLTCIDYITLEKHSLDYIEEGDILICTGNLTKYENVNYLNDFEAFSIVVVKNKDLINIEKEAFNNKRFMNVTIGEVYPDELYLIYDVEDDTNSDISYHFIFVQKVNMTDIAEIDGKIEEGKSVQVEYNDIDYYKNQAKLKKMKVIE